MSEKFHAELDQLKHDSIEMARFARIMLADAVQALILEDIPHATEVKSRKRELRDRTISLEDRAYQLIALYQPMAKDMRVIVCILKIIAGAERIGRYGKDIASMTRHIQDEPISPHPPPLPNMASLVTTMIDDVATAFEKENLALIEDLSSRDDVIDDLWHSMFRQTLTIMMENPKTITRYTSYIMAARYLERCADHACKMAENVHYAMTGNRIEIK
ncbi:MAG: phosphate signaling complex protein PhoU [Methanomicrobiales archaeon]|nr:phosphate signaling complex protein PhoU [Methanoregulaceae archaeon]HPS22705.1 phosphate signaling complex protein PhoU [Methanoregulaceae archaeon]